jgi:hypothetical protein
MARLPTAQENTAISAIFVPTTTYYLGLNTSDPGTTGTGEVTGGSYAREEAAFGAASGGVEATTDAQNFTGMPSESGGIGYFSLWTLVSSGTYLGGGVLSGVASVPVGATVALAIGALTVAIS